MMKRKCFVIMPFGEKKDASGAVIDFDDLYEFMIRGAIEDDLKLECIRCDKIIGPGMIHRDMIQQIFEADVAIVDITTNNPNVFYELGVRHALCKGVTVVIRRAGAAIPFNIQDLRVVDYDPAKVMTLVDARRRIKGAVEAGLQSGKIDSVVHEYLEVRISTPPKRIVQAQRFPFRVRKTASKQIALITGPMEKVTDVDIWVNSENTNMQMARFFDGSISGLIRYLGATKNDRDEVVDDQIAKQLRTAMSDDDARTVAPTAVLKTSAGELERSNGVKFILHAATVQGAIGRGYFPVEGFERSVAQALAKADALENCSSILFPLFGTGTGRGDVAENFGKMLDEAIAYLRHHEAGRIQHVYFLAWTEAEQQATLGVLDRRASELEALPPL